MIISRDCKLEESTEFEDERVRKQWTEHLIIPKAWLPISPIASFVARSTHKQPFLPGREKPRNNIREYRSRNTTSRITQLILFSKYSRKILHDFFLIFFLTNSRIFLSDFFFLFFFFFYIELITKQQNLLRKKLQIKIQNKWFISKLISKSSSL